MCITAWLNTCAQFFYTELNLVPMQSNMCIAEQYLSTCPGALCFCLSPVGNTMHIQCKVYVAILGIVMVLIIIFS